ncbi:MAG: hypothetical protein CMN30_07505 [Sandaracinus sp.]|nr:hypothetical protein [Sandaracinus sp.]
MIGWLVRGLRPWMRRSPLVLLAALGGRAEGAAQEPLGFRDAGPLVVAVDEDDDDENGRRDHEDPAGPLFDAVAFQARGSGWATLETPAELVALRGERPLGPTARIALPAELRLRALSPGRHTVVLRQGANEARLAVQAIRLHFEDGAGPVDPRTRALRPSSRIPNDADLPRDPGAAESPDPAAFRVVATGAESLAREGTLHGLLRAVDAGGRRGRLPVRLHARPDGTFASPWLRLVTDPLDATAPGVEGQLLEVRLRDAVEVDVHGATQSVRVGRPGDEDGPLAARRARLRLHVLRERGRAAVGRDTATARAWAADQVALASRAWTQCLVDFEASEILVHDAPPPALLSFGEPEGFLAAGGVVRLRANGTPIGPVSIPSGSTPLDAALRVAGALESAGFRARVTVNPRAEQAAGATADVLVHRGAALATLTPPERGPLTDDPRLRVVIPRVDLSDGLQEFDNRNATSGSLEERALVLPTGDDDPSTIEVYLVNRFTGETRQGEAFIEADEGALVNTVILDQRGLEQGPIALTHAHELGHVLLDHPFHPDDISDPAPWRLMSARSVDPTIRGPRRITEAECARARDRSGPGARPVLLAPHPSPRGR